jgi:nicotinamide riboside kinase
MPLVAISGSQGTGKSTLIDALPYNKITRKTSRSVLSDWGVTLSQVNNDRPLTIKFQDEILKRKQEDEAIGRDSPDLYVTERTYADLFVYALVAIGKDNEYSDWLDEYYDRCKEAQHKYMEVFYLTGGHFRPVYDGVRGVNEHYSWMVDACMSEYTRRMSGREYNMIDTPDLAERVQTVKAVLQTQQ